MLGTIRGSLKNTKQKKKKHDINTRGRKIIEENVISTLYDSGMKTI